MKDLESVRGTGKHGMLVFVRIPRNILWDESLETETYEYDEKLQPGIIIEVSEYFEDYYLVMFFNGAKAYYWGTDLFIKKEENNLTYLKQ